MCSISDWLVAIGTILLAIVAIFQDQIRKGWRHPLLNLNFITSPDCQKLLSTYPISKTQQVETDTYYIRLRIENNGNEKAENVEVFAQKLMRKSADGKYVTVKSFIPMNLFWSHINVVNLPILPSHVYKNCDIFRVINPISRKAIFFEDKTWENIDPARTILSFDTEVRTYSKNNLACCGTYQLHLIISSANSEPITKIVEINLTGSWFDEEEKMFSEGLGVSIL